jgi:hypothetical protein
LKMGNWAGDVLERVRDQDSIETVEWVAVKGVSFVGAMVGSPFTCSERGKMRPQVLR